MLVCAEPGRGTTATSSDFLNLLARFGRAWGIEDNAADGSHFAVDGSTPERSDFDLPRNRRRTRRIRAAGGSSRVRRLASRRARCDATDTSWRSAATGGEPLLRQYLASGAAAPRHDPACSGRIQSRVIRQRLE